MLVSCSAWGRGLYFHVFDDGDAGVELVAETTRVKRCPRELLRTESGGDEEKVAACGPTDGGHLIALRQGKGARLKLLEKQDTRWQRDLEGLVVFQDGLFVVLDLGGTHRALWLSPVDGSSTRVVDFIEQTAPAPSALQKCDDRLLKWFRGPGRSTAAICFVLD